MREASKGCACVCVVLCVNVARPLGVVVFFLSSVGVGCVLQPGDVSVSAGVCVLPPMIDCNFGLMTTTTTTLGEKATQPGIAHGILAMPMKTVYFMWYLQPFFFGRLF